MADETQIVEPPAPTPGSPMADQLDEDVKRLIELRQQRILIDEEIRRLIGRVRNPIITPDAARPTWGPCTRCGHTWLGMWPDRPPVGCPRCGSTGWRYAPRKAGARVPGDPPNPRWAKKRSLADKKLKPERKVRPERKFREEHETALTPPPKFEEVARSSKLVLVPPPQVRFAERRQEPDPMRSVSNPVGLTAGDTKLEVYAKIDSYLDEPYEAVEGDGSMETDDGREQ